MAKQKSDKPEDRDAASPDAAGAPLTQPGETPEGAPAETGLETAPETEAELPPADPDAAIAPMGDAPAGMPDETPAGATPDALSGTPGDAPVKPDADARPEAVADLPGADLGAPETGAAETVDPAALPIEPPYPDPAPAADPVPLAAMAPPAEPPADPPGDPHHEEEEAHEEERGWSFAARALAVLLLLIAGAAVGIWAAPRLAPQLPAGMAPVASWLTPGRSAAEAELAEARAALDARIAELSARIDALPGGDAIAQQAQSAATPLVTDAENRLGARMDQIEETISQSDVEALGARVGQVESTLEGAETQLDSLRSQIESGAAGAEAQTAASIDTYRAELDGVKAEVGRLAGAVSGLGARLDEAEASAAARVQEVETQAEQAQAEATTARNASAARAELERIRADLANGEPYGTALAALSEATGEAPPAGLEAAAATGAPTLAALRSSFGDAAHQAIRASIVASAGEGFMARTRAYLESQVASRSLAPRAGLDPDAVLSRMEDALRRDDLPAALAEARNLPSEARAAMQGWIDDASRRAEAEAGLAELDAALGATN